MGGFGYVCAVVLAAVFVRAGTAKLARLDQTEVSFAGLRLPAAGLLARLVPVVELTLAVLLVAFPPLGGVASLIILVVFTAVLLPAIASGVQVSCSCFGAARADPVSRVDLVRNVLLAGLAVTAVFTSAPTMPSLGQAGAALALCAVGGGIMFALSVLRR